nr:hypothetical protein [Chryseobacterium capnotolerans]
MKQFGIILIFLGVAINAQHRKVKKDSIAHIAEVKVKSNKRKLKRK